MRRKILLFIFAFFAVILPIIDVKADLVCFYKDNRDATYFKIVFDTDRNYPYSGVLYKYYKYYKIEQPEPEEYKVSGKRVKVYFENECPDKIASNIGQIADNYYIIKYSELNSPPKDGGSNWYELDLVEQIDDSTANKVYCGSEEQGRVTGIPKKLPELTSSVITIIQIAIPVILVLLGTLDLFKGVTAGKEDEMKKGQQMFIKRLIVAAVIFFVVVIVKFLVSVIADTNQTNIVDCIDCFVSNDCEEM